MKAFFKSSSPFCLFILVCSLASCQKDNIVPNAPEVTNQTPTASAVIPAPPSIYTLTQLDTKVLSYDANWRLIKVTDGNRYQTYTYRPQRITMKKYTMGRSTMPPVDSTVDYYLDAQGRCLKTIETYTKQGVIQQHTAIYEYNQQGRLSKYYTMNAPAEQTFYIYSAEGDLGTVVRYDTAGVLTYSDNYSTEYTPLEDSKLAFTYPLNLVNDPSLNEFLPIYGKPAKHLFKWYVRLVPVYYNMAYLMLATSVTYQYTFNGNGLPIGRKVLAAGTNNLLSTNAYTYCKNNVVVK